MPDMSLPLPTVHPKLASASTLPARVYTDPAYFPLERERIFFSSWQQFCRTDQVDEPGKYFSGEIASLPVVCVRDSSGTLRAFANVCRHRASLLVAGSGKAAALRCPYHGWVYGLDGHLKGAPEFDGAANFEKQHICLPEFRTATWGPFVFVWVGEAQGTKEEPKPLEYFLGAIPQEITDFGVDFSQYGFYERRTYEVRCNWKAYIDNYMEPYHIPLVHPGLARELDYKKYRVDVFPTYTSQQAPLKQDPLASNRQYEAKDGSGALYYWLYPNFMVNVYPDNMSSNLILPIGADRTLCIFEWFLPKGAHAATPEAIAATMAFSEQVQQEDIRICEVVQRGLGSGAYDKGRFSPARENGLHHFHRMVCDSLQGTR